MLTGVGPVFFILRDLKEMSWVLNTKNSDYNTLHTEMPFYTRPSYTLT